MTTVAGLRLADALDQGGAARDRRIAVVLLALGLIDLAVLDLWALPRAMAPRPFQSALLRAAVSLPVAPATPRLEAPPRPPAPAERVPDRPERVLFFATGVDGLTDSQRATVDQAAHDLRSAIEADAGLVLEVEGHADGRGAAHSNQSLSLRRARAVARRLGQRGVDRQHIRIAGFGATRSRTASDGLESLRGDRRVEIYLRRGLR